MKLDKLKQINWKHPKYVLPLIVYIPVMATAYFILDMFDTKLAEKPSNLETTEYLNANLPKAQIKDDGIGKRYDNMLESFGKIQDYSAVESIEGDEEKKKEKYDSKYSEEDLAMLEADADKRARELERMKDMQERIKNSADKGRAMSSGTTTIPTEEERLAQAEKRQNKALEELQKALAEARKRGETSVVQKTDSSATEQAQVNIRNKEMSEKKIVESAVTANDENAESKVVVKKQRPSSSYFYTISDGVEQNNLVKAIIDENITAVEGSRVRLRLLDDVEIDNHTLSRGSYLYATMSGFGSQRVKGQVESILIEDEIVKVSLSLYDTDGLEGLYVPESQFRETAKDVAGSAVGGSMSMSGTGTGNMLEQWGVQALNNAYQKTTNALSKAVRKNKAKLKYGTFVYLINGREKNK